VFLDRCRADLSVDADGDLGTDRDRLLSVTLPRSIHVEFDPPGPA
jgi:hypothetical protein